ncbi:MAG: LPS-assembly protein LptD, partial [Proteobacteria bacterium]|nr:LPS-assembly protein LptD [Pseudomonadota bacterium]
MAAINSIAPYGGKLTCFLSIAALVCAPPAALAQAPEAPTPSRTHQPVLLQADEIDYDQQNDVVFASGHVEIVQGESMVMADTIIYDQKRGQVQAMGHVSMLEPSGHVLFADALALQDDLKRGVIQNFKARLNDGSIFVASGARKIDEDRTELYKAAFTPCRCEQDGNPIPPTWSMRAKKAVIDQKEQKVKYEDAYLRVLDVPVLYTPYFSHPTPDAPNQSGLLMPEFMQSRNLGAVYKQPIYYAISPDKDLTLTPIYTTQEGLVMASNYRQQLDSGSLRINASATRAEQRDDKGNHIPGHQFRGHIDSRGAFKLDDHYNWGFDVRRATDETYLRLYNFGNDPFLNSRIYAEGFNFLGNSDRNYASIEGLSFQGLTNADASAVIPVVAPLMNFNWQSKPLDEYKSRISFDGGTAAVFRDRGAQSRRMSGTLRYTLPYVTKNGQVFELQTQLRSDFYHVDSLQQQNGKDFQGTTGRVMPQASLLWRYPLINRMENASVLIEPIVNVILAPGGGNPQNIPNEDSLLPDFNDANLFSNQRYAGFDRVESGPRVTYGMRGEAQLDGGPVLDAMLGQEYRFISDAGFPISSNRGSDLSDYVGRLGLSQGSLSASYRFKIDQELLTIRRNEVEVTYNKEPFGLAASYL